MNNKPENTDDFLRELFQKMPEQRVSEGFSVRLIAKIEKVAERKKKRSEILSFLWPLCGSLLICFASVFTFKILKIDIKEGILHSFQSIEISPLVIAIGLLVLFLLITDTLLRKHIQRKKNESV